MSFVLQRTKLGTNKRQYTKVPTIRKLLIQIYFIRVSWKPYGFSDTVIKRLCTWCQVLKTTIFLIPYKMSDLSLRLSSSLSEASRYSTKERIAYHSIKMNLQEIKELAFEVDKNVKKVREEIEVTASLLAKLLPYEDQE